MKDGIEQYVEALQAAATAGDEYAAVAVVQDAHNAGVPLECLFLDVVAVAQARIGAEWAANRLTVAQEHTATAVNERVLAVLAHTIDTTDHGSAPLKWRICVACVEGEWHTFPARLLTEVLRLRGWLVDYLGAHVPTQHLIVHLHRTAPDMVALSSSIATRLPAAHAVISACQAAGTPVLVGGAAFGPDGRYARLLGADAWAPDARAAADLLDGGPLPRGHAHALSAERQPHLACHEYALFTDRKPDLVRGALQELSRRVPQTGPRSAEPPVLTAEDVAFTVDFLGTAVYVKDPDLFASFTRWLAWTLTQRDVPPRALTAVLDAVSARLTGLPNALDALARGREALRT
ncbi:cobalamin B12-binding domain-containing protein [Nonomuraea glycinis]|uniref:cobalamin B12-binding domain-containing protein n=1 Tax=Nonomuraea glycinis TaxID=2047744 RepID=UPI002E167E45|nr:cobalamin-dependent protein [Nonomuraea glycinis]WSG71085.1 cobalamin-dependent protein [Nonomuraea glycinis]